VQMTRVRHPRPQGAFASHPKVKSVKREAGSAPERPQPTPRGRSLVLLQGNVLILSEASRVAEAATL